MKRLTIGSLKYESVIKKVDSIESPVVIEKKVTKKANEAVIEVEQNQKSFHIQVKKGQPILEAALEQNLPLDYSCKKGTCGKCKVKIIKGSTNLQPVNSLERKKLSRLVEREYRLACQAIAR
jgi:ferredoxin, 2Fe-2S